VNTMRMRRRNVLYRRSLLEITVRGRLPISLRSFSTLLIFPYAILPVFISPILLNSATI